MKKERRRGLGIMYDVLISAMGVISFLFSYVGISMANVFFSLGLNADAINVLSIAIFILISWYGLGIIINHRAIGPMGAVKRHFSIIANGDYYLQFRLRRGDDLKHVSDHLNQMSQTLIDKEKASIQRLKSLRKELVNLETKSSQNPDVLTKEIKEFSQRLI